MGGEQCELWLRGHIGNVPGDTRAPASRGFDSWWWGVWLGSRRGGLRGLKRPSGMLMCLLCPLRPVRPPHLTRLGQRRGQACVCSVLGSGRSARGDASQGDGPPLTALAADRAPRLNAPTSHLPAVMHSRSGRHPGPGVRLPALHVWLPGLDVRPPDSLRVPPGAFTQLPLLLFSETQGPVSKKAPWLTDKNQAQQKTAFKERFSKAEFLVPT